MKKVLETWLIEILIGIGKLFINPLLYYGVFFTYLLGYLRAKQERKDFHVKVEDPLLELTEYLKPSLLAGLILSIITGVIGLNVPSVFLWIIAVVTFLISLTLRTRYLSPVYTIGLTFFIIILLKATEVDIFKSFIGGFEQTIYPSIVVLLGLLIIAEGILIKRRGSIQPSPLLETGKRGLIVGAQKAKRVWFIPVLLFIPNGILTVPVDWWPVFTFGDAEWSPILFPFFIGFSLKAKSTLISNIVKPYGNMVLYLGLVVTALAVVGRWYPIISIITVGIALIGREFIHFMYQSKENKLTSFFSSRSNGVMILGVLPESPADRMGLKAGELLTRVNGNYVTNSAEFYEALQSNRAHCKLEVYDTNGQIRLVQRALYEGDHHELGILAVESEKPL